MIYALISVRESPGKGRGMFAEEAIAGDTVIEESPAIVLTKEERIHLDKTLLHDYIFEWNTGAQHCCMALGNIPIYNHSYKSNCEYFMDYEDETMTIKTVRAIEKGEELTINYNGDITDATPLWFEAE